MIRVDTTSRVQTLVTQVEASIAQRRLRPGDRVATLDELRASSGLARQTVSEAARLLAERGIVEIRLGRNGGLFVAHPSPVVRLRHTLLSVPRGSASVADAIAVRDALEELVDTDAARLRTAGDARDLRKALGTLRRSTSHSADFIAANWALHERISQITANDLARAVYQGSLRCMSDLAVGAETDPADDSETYLHERVEIHTELVEAIIAGDVRRTAAAVARHRGLRRGVDPPR